MENLVRSQAAKRASAEGRGSSKEGGSGHGHALEDICMLRKPTIDMVIGRKKYAQSRQLALARLWKGITGQAFSTDAAYPLHMNKDSLRKNSSKSEAFCRATACLMMAGLEEVVEAASWSVARLNSAYNVASLPMPSSVLDLVYLMNGTSITWKLVEIAAASVAHEAMLPKQAPSRKRKAICDASTPEQPDLHLHMLPGDQATLRSEGHKPTYNVGFWSHDLYNGLH